MPLAAVHREHVHRMPVPQAGVALVPPQRDPHVPVVGPLGQRRIVSAMEVGAGTGPRRRGAWEGWGLLGGVPTPSLEAS